MALVDTDTTHNFVSVKEAKKLGLKVKKGERWAKTVNSKAKLIKELVRSATIT